MKLHLDAAATRRLLIARSLSVGLLSISPLALAAHRPPEFDAQIAGGRDRIELTFTGPHLEISALTLLTPARLVIDLAGCTYGPAVDVLLARFRSHSLVETVRASQFRPNVLRIVLVLRCDPAKGPDALRVLRERHATRVTLAFPVQRPDAPKPKRPAPRSRTVNIVIDPGHGGADPGAIGRNKTREKDIVLAIAQKLAAELHGVRGVRVALTRESDVFVPLLERRKKAHQMHADLFLSLHADAWKEERPMGCSVFTLSTDSSTSQHNRWLAQSQNQTDSIAGFDFKEVEDRHLSTFVSLQSEGKLLTERLVGGAMLIELSKISALHHDEIESAEFLVLKTQGIPGILVETGFLSNRQDEKRLRDPVHQTRIAKALARAIRANLSALTAA